MLASVSGFWQQELHFNIKFFQAQLQKKFKVFLSPTDSVSLLLFLRCHSVSRCSALRLSVQLVQLSSKLICLRATFPCPFTLFSSFINLIAHSLISLCLSPSLVLWPIPKGSIVKVSQPISVQLMYCPLPNVTSIVSKGTSPLCSRAASQKKGWMMLLKEVDV